MPKAVRLTAAIPVHPQVGSHGCVPAVSMHQRVRFPSRYSPASGPSASSLVAAYLRSCRAPGSERFRFRSATPTRRRGVRAGRQARVPAAPCARSRARCPRSGSDRRSRPGSVRAGDDAARGPRRRDRSSRGRSSVSSQRQHDRPFHDRRDRLDDIGGFRHQCRALLDQIVGAGRARIERRARHGKNLAALLSRPCAR